LLAAMLTWVGLRANGLSSALYGPEKAYALAPIRNSRLFWPSPDTGAEIVIRDNYKTPA
jgi:hypothetical protein